MNVLITGANGQLGSEIRNLVSAFPDFTFHFTDVAELDITNISEIRKLVTDLQIKAIINCAAYTAVDKAETEKNLAFAINSEAVKNLALVAKEFNAVLVHISTDYVFNGEKNTPYNEQDSTNPTGAYGESKLAGENAMLEINPKGIIIRTSWLYSSFGNNFVKTMLRLGKQRTELGVVYDQIGTPTYAADLAKAILDILPQIGEKQTEIFHYSNEGVCSWYDFANEIFRLSQTTIKLNAIESAEFPTPTKRPAYSVLNKHKIKTCFGIQIPHWTESLSDCLAIYVAT